MVIVTGTSSSRLTELRKYRITGDLSELYFTSTSNLNNGVNVLLSTGNTVVYYLGGITYTDIITTDNTITTFTFDSLGYDDLNNFDNLPIIKDETKENIIDKPEVENDVFIIRQSIPVFENQYRFSNIRNLAELEFYAGGGFFNIINNS